MFLATSESGANDRIWKEIKKTIHTDADKLFKKIREAYAVLSVSNKRKAYKLKLLKDDSWFGIYVEDHIHSDRGNMENHWIADYTNYDDMKYAPAANEGQKTLPEGAKGDSTKITTPDIVEEQQVTQNWPFRVVLGLQCKAVTLLQSKKAETPQSFTPLSPKTTGNQEDTGANDDLTVKRKRGSPFKVKRRGKLPKTPLAVAVTNETGDAIPGAVNGDNALNRGAETELALPHDAFNTVKGKRGKRRSIIILESEAAPQVPIADILNDKLSTEDIYRPP
nr:hypothetical protein [Tanacetum cinerariifolium]